MPRRDSEGVGRLADLAARVRLGPHRGLGSLAGAPMFEPVLKKVAEMAAVQEDDNVAWLGAADLRPLQWIAPACRQITVVDDLGDAALAELEKRVRARGMGNVSFVWGTPEHISVPQHTADRVVAVNHLYRTRRPEVAVRQVFVACRHASRVVLCEPSARLDARTARKYSREAELPMPDHEALVAYARAASAYRGFTREGLEALLSRHRFVDIELRELLHGLVVAAKATVKL